MRLIFFFKKTKIGYFSMNFVLHSLIIHTLKKYLQNFEAFQLSLFQGEIYLSKISLIQKAFNEFIASITENLRIYKGNISKFRLVIPWSSLTSKSIHINASDVQINLHFSHFDQLLQAEKAFFGIKEEIKNSVYPEVDESLIQKFLNKVINNLKFNLEKISINVDVLDIYTLQVTCNDLEIYNCRENGDEYEYIQSKKIISKIFIFKGFSIKFLSKTGKEIEILKFEHFRFKMFIKNEQYFFDLKNLQETNIAIDLSLLNFFFERAPAFFFKEKIIKPEQPIAFLLYNNIEMLKNSFVFKYCLEKVSFSIGSNFEEEFNPVNQNIQISDLNIQFSSGGFIQKYCLNFNQIDFFSKSVLFLSLKSNENEDFHWKFSKISEQEDFEYNFQFELIEKRQENINLFEYDYKILISHVNYFLDVFQFLQNLKEIIWIYETFTHDLDIFLTKIQEKKEFQKKLSNNVQEYELEKNEVVNFPPKIIYNYSLIIIKNRIDLSMFGSFYYLFFSFLCNYKGTLSRKSGSLKKMSFIFKPYQIKLEDINEIKILEIINLDLIYEKFEKKARISNFKIVICELFFRALKSTIIDLNLIHEKLMDSINQIFRVNSNSETQTPQKQSFSKDFQSNIQIKIMNLNFYLGEIIYVDFNEPIKKIFREIFDLKLSKIEVFGIENASFQGNEEKLDSCIPIINCKTLKSNFKLELFFIDPLFFETQSVINKINIHFCYDFLDCSQNKLEFLDMFQINISPEILQNLIFMCNIQQKFPVSFVKYIKNETSQTLYLKSHHFLKNEQVTILEPGQCTVLALSHGRFDNHLNFYQVGMKFHIDDEIPNYSERFYVSYDENKSIKDFKRNLTISGFLQNEEIQFHLQTIDLEKEISSEVLCIFADWYLINLLFNQRINLFQSYKFNNEEKPEFLEIKPKIFKNPNDSLEIIENLLKSNNKNLNLPLLVQDKLFLSQYAKHSTIEEFLDPLNEYVMADCNMDKTEKLHHIYFKKNPNFKFLTYKLYSRFENDDNTGKNLFYVDVFQKDGINYTIIKPFILISNKTDKTINLALKEYINQNEEGSTFDKHKILPESFYSLISSVTSNIYCTKIFFEFYLEHHNLSFHGQKIVYKTYNEENAGQNSHILQFMNENNFCFDVILFNNKIDETSILQFDYPLEIFNETEYVIIIKIKKMIDPIIIQPFETHYVLKHLSHNNADSLLFSILQKGNLMFSNTNFIEVISNELFLDKIHLLSFNFTKLNEDYLNVKFMIDFYFISFFRFF